MLKIAFTKSVGLGPPKGMSRDPGKELERKGKGRAAGPYLGPSAQN